MYLSFLKLNKALLTIFLFYLRKKKIVVVFWLAYLNVKLKDKYIFTGWLKPSIYII